MNVPQSPRSGGLVMDRIRMLTPTSNKGSQMKSPASTVADLYHHRSSFLPPTPPLSSNNSIDSEPSSLGPDDDSKIVALLRKRLQESHDKIERIQELHHKEASQWKVQGIELQRLRKDRDRLLEDQAEQRRQLSESQLQAQETSRQLVSIQNLLHFLDTGSGKVTEGAKTALDLQQRVEALVQENDKLRKQEGVESFLPMTPSGRSNNNHQVDRAILEIFQVLEQLYEMIGRTTKETRSADEVEVQDSLQESCITLRAAVPSADHAAIQSSFNALQACFLEQIESHLSWEAKLEQLKRSNMDLVVENDSLKKALDEWKDLDARDAQEVASMLEEWVKHKKRDAEVAQAEMDRLNDIIRNLEEDLREKESEIEILEEVDKEDASRVGMLEKLLAGSTSKVDKLARDLKKSESERKALKQEVRDAQSKMQNIQADHEFDRMSTEGEIGLLMKAKNTAEKARDDLAMKLSLTEYLGLGKEDELKKHKDLADRLRRELNETKGLLQASRDSSDKVEESKNQLEAKRVAMEHQLNEALSEAEEARAIGAAQQRELAKLQSRVESQEEQLESLKKDLATSERTSQQLQEKRIAVNDPPVEKSRLHNLRREMENLSQERDGLLHKLEDRDAEIKSLRDRLEAADQSLECPKPRHIDTKKTIDFEAFLSTVQSTVAGESTSQDSTPTKELERKASLKQYDLLQAAMDNKRQSYLRNLFPK